VKLSAASMLEHDCRKCDVIFGCGRKLSAGRQIEPAASQVSNLAVNESAHFMSIAGQLWHLHGMQYAYDAWLPWGVPPATQAGESLYPAHRTGLTTSPTKKD